jgi:hypothetical protein
MSAPTKTKLTYLCPKCFTACDDSTLYSCREVKCPSCSNIFEPQREVLVNPASGVSHYAFFKRKELIGEIFQSLCGREFYIGMICRFHLEHHAKKEVNCSQCLKSKTKKQHSHGGN